MVTADANGEERGSMIVAVVGSCTVAEQTTSLAITRPGSPACGEPERA